MWRSVKGDRLEAACRLSIFYLPKTSILSSCRPVSLQLRASNEGLLRPRVARARRETGLPARSLRVTFDSLFDAVLGCASFASHIPRSRPGSGAHCPNGP